MFRKNYTLLLMLIIGVFVLAACGGSDAPADAPEAGAVTEVEAEPTEAPVEEAEAEGDSDAAEESTEMVAGAQTFVVDSSASSASYVVEEEFLADALSKLGIDAGLQTIVGTTTEVSGQLEVDPTSAAFSSASFEVNLTGLTTDQDRRDGYIQDKGPQLGSFPIAMFVASEVVGAPESYADGEEVTFQLVGELTIRDSARTTTFDVTATVSGDMITGMATSEPMLLSDFGIDPPNFANTLSVADEFHVEVALTAMAQ